MSHTIYSRLLIALSLFALSIPASAALMVNEALPITHRVTVQPIVLSNDDGSNPATFFGNADQRAEIEGFVDQIWAQAGIDVNFLDPTGWNNTFANIGNQGPNQTRPGGDLSAIRTQAGSLGLLNPDPNVINIFFVSIPPAFGSLSDNTAAGLAYVGGNGITQYVGSNLPGFNGGRETIAGVVAHEIGHNLGLGHTAREIPNLMSPSGTSDQLVRSISEGNRTVNQIDIALNSRFSIEIDDLVGEPITPVSEVPVPAAFWLFGSAALVLLRNRRQPQALIARAA